MSILEVTQSKINRDNSKLGEMNEKDQAYILKIAAIADRDGIEKIKSEYNKVWSQVDEANRYDEDATVLQRKMDSLEFVLVASGVEYD